MNAEAFRTRLVMLGASNLAMGSSTILSQAHQVFPGPIDVLIACGHGRSYLGSSRIPFRELPGIVECKLWDDLAQRDALPTKVIVTDIGNDILYGAKVDEVLRAIEVCVTRLTDAGAEIAMTGLPVSGLPSLGPRRFEIFRQLFFPRCKYTLDEVKRLACELDQRLEELACDYTCHWLAMNREWYGFDPIHLRNAHAAYVWQLVVDLLRDEKQLKNKRESVGRAWRRWWQCQTATPATRKLFGSEREFEQPSMRLDDASCVSWY